MTPDKICSVLACLMGIATTVSAGDQWPEWRGPGGQGYAQVRDLPVSWSETEHVAWKVAVPGRGWSTPVIENGQVWVTTGVDTPASKTDAERRRKTTTNAQPLTISETVSLRAVGLDLKTGDVLHNIEVITRRDPQMIHQQNSYATPTPIIENGRLYCHYGPYGIACVDVRSQKVLWLNQSLDVKHENGPGSSPVLWENYLIVHCDGIDQQYIVAIDKNTGKQVWKTNRTGTLRDDVQMRKSYATSLIVDVETQPQVISPGADWVYGYDPVSGRELWKLSYGLLGFSNASRPIAGNGLIYVCTGYLNARMLAIRVDQKEGRSFPQVVWSLKKQVPNVSSPLMVGQEIYFVSDNGLALCVDAKTGKVHWIQRIGAKFWASPLYADGRIYFFGSEGDTTVIEPGRSFRKLANNKLDGTMFATGAAVDGSLVLRTDQALYCLR